MSTLENNILLSNTPNDDNEAKETNDIDEIVIYKKNNCTPIFFLTILFLPIFIISSIIEIYKMVIILDGKNKQIFHVSRIFMVVDVIAFSQEYMILIKLKNSGYIQVQLKILKDHLIK